MLSEWVGWVQEQSDWAAQPVPNWELPVASQVVPEVSAGTGARPSPVKNPRPSGELGWGTLESDMNVIAWASPPQPQ